MCIITTTNPVVHPLWQEATQVPKRRQNTKSLQKKLMNMYTCVCNKKAWWFFLCHRCAWKEFRAQTRRSALMMPSQIGPRTLGAQIPFCDFQYMLMEEWFYFHLRTNSCLLNVCWITMIRLLINSTTLTNMWVFISCIELSIWCCNKYHDLCFLTWCKDFDWIS